MTNNLLVWFKNSRFFLSQTNDTYDIFGIIIDKANESGTGNR